MKTLILGFDAFDPSIFERLCERGQTPNLAKYVDANGYNRLEVSNPPQSEVSWTSIATGLNPGEHGLFDFVHRNPNTYKLNVSLLPTTQSFAGTKFAHPYNAHTLFDETAARGFPATSLWWPATFPARPESPVRALPGLGTPDIHGRLGVGTLFTSDIDLPALQGKTPIKLLKRVSKETYTQELAGPILKKKNGERESTIQFQIDLDSDQSASLRIGKQQLKLKVGIWSPVLNLVFKLGPFIKVQVLTRLILTHTQPHISLYVLPLQIHPLHSPWPYATPRSFVKTLWKSQGAFLTIGWPQDTTALEEKCISDSQFLVLCDSIFTTRRNILMKELSNFHEGVLAIVFDSLDRIQHMFWRDRMDIIENWYIKLDAVVGEIDKELEKSSHEPAQVLIISDHGFTDFNYKVHLNRWLIEKGYLNQDSKNGAEKLSDVVWPQTQAFAIGLNSIYLNIAGREAQGKVQPGELEETANKIRTDLMSWQGPDGKQVVQNAWLNDQAFSGPFSAYGPDLVVGFSPGYRASAQTGLGEWTNQSIEPNRDHWGGDHCIDPTSVPGVIFARQGLEDFHNPSYRDIPFLAIGMAPRSGGSVPPASLNDEETDIVEERLKSLGYL